MPNPIPGTAKEDGAPQDTSLYMDGFRDCKRSAMALHPDDAQIAAIAPTGIPAKDEGPPQNTLWVGNFNGEVSITHPNLQTDSKGVGYVIFSPDQARGLAQSLQRHADVAEGGRQCIHCGCTEHTPCTLGDALLGNICCSWMPFGNSVCSNPECIYKENEALRRGAN